MKWMARFLLGLLMFWPLAGIAGTRCVETPLGLEEFAKASTQAQKVWQFLESHQNDIEIAVVGRVGADLSEQGLTYSHAGFIVRDHPKGKWLFRHMLNQCGTKNSGLFDQGLLNFFLDDQFRFQAVIATPIRSLQQKLLPLVKGPAAQAMFDPHYSMLAYPFSTRYQNSNQWVLELLAVAADPQQGQFDRRSAQVFLKDTGFQGSIIEISPFKRLGAGLFAANVAFDDHPAEDDLEGRYSVVTVESILQWMAQNKMILRQDVIRTE